MGTDSARVRLLDVEDAEARATWLDLWRAWPTREIFAHPDYVALHATETMRGMCAAMQTASGGVLFPFILRPLAAEAWVSDDDPAHDLITPYGYGGAFQWGDAHQHAGDFWRGVEDALAPYVPVSTFARLSLFPDQILPFDGEVSYDSENIVCALRGSTSEMWASYAHKVRKNVKRAQSEGLTVEIDDDGRRLDAFIDIYYDTMRRRSAREYYWFPRSFFEALAQNLAGHYAFFHVLQGREVISTELVLISVDYIYSFLGGTKEGTFAARPNDLLKHEVICWGLQRQKRAFVLGGGPEGVVRYKRAFAPEGSTPFRVGKAIHDQRRYDALIEQRRSWNAARAITMSSDPRFFPAYRSPDVDEPNTPRV